MVYLHIALVPHGETADAETATCCSIGDDFHIAQQPYVVVVLIRGASNDGEDARPVSRPRLLLYAELGALWITFLKRLEAIVGGRGPVFV
jgi:hypothetical protein